ncbi:hypothetical protein, partial [Tianweitania sediminis]
CDDFDPAERSVRGFGHSLTHRRMPMPYQLCRVSGQNGVRSRALRILPGHHQHSKGFEAALPIYNFVIPVNQMRFWMPDRLQAKSLFTSRLLVWRE